MDLGILNIGDELLAGKILNGNQFDLARLLTPRGHRLAYGLVIGDDRAAIAATLKTALAGTSAPFAPVDVLVLTGGLGPTRDDVTREAVAAYLGVPLVENSEALGWLADLLRKPATDLPPGQRVQSLIPSGSEPLRNPAGTACGFRFRSGPTWVYAFPGVPRELEAMATLHLLPSLAGDRILLQKGVWTWNWSEGLQREALESLSLPADYQFSSLPVERGVRISLQVLVPSAEASLREVEFDQAWRAVLSAIPSECLVHPEGLSLPAAVQNLLLERQATVSVAESCTGGGLAQLLTETPGSSAVFHRGFLTYSNQAKIDLLGVPESVLADYGAVSEEVSKAMVSGCLQRSGSTYACAITGIAGPDGGTPDKPVGTVWIAVAGPSGSSESSITVLARSFKFRGDRQAIRQRSALMALNQIRLLIQGKLI